MPLGSLGVRLSPARERRVLLRFMTPHEAPSVEQDAIKIRALGATGITLFEGLQASDA
jgi:hypothetical protein